MFNVPVPSHSEGEHSHVHQECATEESPAKCKAFGDSLVIPARSLWKLGTR